MLAGTTRLATITPALLYVVTAAFLSCQQPANAFFIRDYSTVAGVRSFYPHDQERLHLPIASSADGNEQTEGNNDDITYILSGNTEENTVDSNGNIDFKNFNPLSYQTDAKKKQNSLLNDYSTGTPISLRKTTMQELTTALFSAVGNEEQTQSIIKEYHNFLIEPLDDPQAVLVSFGIFAIGLHGAVATIMSPTATASQFSGIKYHSLIV